VKAVGRARGEALKRDSGSREIKKVYMRSSWNVTMKWNKRLEIQGGLAGFSWM
jgi:hypothetical protein